MYDYDRRTAASKLHELQALAVVLKSNGIEAAGVGKHGAIFQCKNRREVARVQEVAEKRGFTVEAHGFKVFVM